MYEFSSYADIARNVQKNHTFTTNFVTPMELASLEQKNLSKPPWPMTFRFPLFPVILASSFSIFGASDITVIWTNGIIFAFFVVSIFLLGRLIFPKPWYVSLIASIIAAINPIFWCSFVLFGYASDFLFGIFLFLHFGILSLLLSKPERIRPNHFVWFGVLGFLTYLSRYNFVLFLPAIALIILSQRFLQKKLCVSYYLGTFLGLTVLFQIYWRIMAGGSQSISFTANLAHLSQTDSLPWLDYRILSLRDLLLNHPWAIMRKGFYFFVPQLMNLLRQFGYLLVVPFTICALCFGLRTPETPGVKKIFSQLYLTALLVHVVFFVFLRVEAVERYLLWLTPFTLLVGIEYFLVFVKKNLPKFRGVIYFIAALFMLSWFLYQSMYSLKSIYRGEWASESPKTLEWKILKDLIPPNSLVVSNVGVHLAWYIQRPCIDLPNTMEDLKKILNRYSVEYVYIADFPQGELNTRPYWHNYVRTLSGKEKFSKEISAVSEYQFRDSTLWAR
jgi:hypothetical protein